MGVLNGSRIGTGDRCRITDVCYSGVQSSKGNQYSKPRLKFRNPYSNGNQCPIDLHKWKENGFTWNNKGWFRKAKHLASEAPQNWYPPLEPNISDAAPERDNPHSDSLLVPLIVHGNPQNWNGCFMKYNSRADQARSNLLESCLFVKWGGGKRVKDNFESWCRAQWGKDISINILPNDFYMIEFMSNKDKWQAQNKGPYILDGIEVHTIDWQPTFNPRMYVQSDSKVWIRLYNYPLDYWHIDVIKDICKDLSTFVSADDILEDKLWGSFLGICISMDQITKIPDEVKIIGAGKIRIQKIDREDQLHICPKCFFLDHIGISCDVLAMIQRSYYYIQSPIEVNLQPKPSIAFDTEEAICNNTLDNENVPLTEETPLIIIPPSSGQCESQQELLTLLEKTKTLHADIESKIVDSLPPSPCVPGNQLIIEDGNLHSPAMETDTLREMGGQIYSSTGIELEDGEIETSTSKGEEDFEPDSDLILEGTLKAMSFIPAAM
ncbi:hypothetical protein SUGI_0055490 [Cryptomeria japonica]|nr:hypothetical protein SUGI_0055490 [Cryptomeria japonica]